MTSPADLLLAALHEAEEGLNAALGIVEVDHYLPDWDWLKSVRKNIRAAIRTYEAGQKEEWKLGDHRCDFCDNGLDSSWAFCPWCSRRTDTPDACIAERAPPVQR